jgi:type I restriction enzyme, S subunit
VTPVQLFDHFNRISEAPDAIPRLRLFILDLAVRGKLVEQDPKDEPASELLKRIEAEKARLVKTGEIKKLETFDPVEDHEISFATPPGWEVIRMGWLARKLGAGSTPLGGKTVYQSEGVPFLRSQNVHDDGLRLDDVALISRSVHERMSGTHVQHKDLLLNITGASIGRCALVPSTLREANVSQHVAIIRLFLSDIRQFIHLSLISPFFQRIIDDVQVGVSREGLSMQRLRQFPMLLPPLAEQHRIVAKVDELMAQCDRLEAAHAERESRRDGLAAASLHGLNNETDADAFCGHARFYFNHFPRLTTRAEHIHQLRQTILTLAVRGKLVTQDPSDEPALTFLKRIAKDWRKRDESVDDLTSDAFEVPNTWIWIKLGACVESMSNGIYKPAKFYSETGTACVRMFNIQDGRLDLSKLKRLDLSKEEIEHYRLEPGDLLVNRVNSRELVGKCAVVTASEEPLVFEAMNIRVRLVERQQLSHYINLVLRTERVRALFQGAAKQAVGQASVNQPQVANMAIPLPPLAEQHRIVAKVDDLMVLCDRLEAQLTISQSESRRLLEAVLHEALSPSEGEVVS